MGYRTNFNLHVTLSHAKKYNVLYIQLMTRNVDTMALSSMSSHFDKVIVFLSVHLEEKI